MTSTQSSTSHINGVTIENAFPTPPMAQNANDTLFRLRGTLSPPPKRLRALERAQSTPPETTHSNQFGILTRSTAGQLSDVASLESSWQRLNLSRKRSQYYNDAFAYREPNNTAKERVAKDAVIQAEIKLNCCLESENDFLIDVSWRLSEIYHRPASCIMVSVTAQVSMLLGGNSEPAYHFTIIALSPEIAATKNKRNTHLIQDFMLDLVQIPPRRGIVQFEAVAEENLATNGITTLQEIEHLERESSDMDGRLRALSRQSKRSKKSTAPALTERLRASIPSLRATTSSQQILNTIGAAETKTTGTSGLGKKRVKKRQSIMAFFKR